MEKLLEVLKKRGFLVDVNENYIYFSMGNHENELPFLVDLFNELNIMIRVDGRKIFLLEEVSEEVLTNLIWYEASNHEAGGGSGLRSWKYFIKRKHGPKINTFTLETGVALLVKALSASGIVTNCSCHGHGKRAPVITFCGHHNAIWFNIVFDEIKDNLKLNYKWDMYLPFRADVNFGPRFIMERWNLEKILEDTLQIAEYFLANQGEISNLKQQIYRGNYKTNRKLVHSLNYGQLSDWMRTRYYNYINNQEERI